MKKQKKSKILSTNVVNSNAFKLSMLIAFWQIPTTSLANGAPDSGWRTTMTAAYAWQGESDLNDDGKFSVDRGVLQMKFSKRTGKRWFTGFSLGYEEDYYKFSSTSASPWDDIRTLQMGVSLRYLASEKWSIFGLPLLRFSAERGTDLSEGRELGLITGASYKFSDTLTLGPGFGIISGIGGEEDFFPILLIDWKLTDSLSLETGRGLAASRGPGLTLNWKPAKQWKFAVAARYEKSRFRLADRADSIGEDKSVPVVLSATWNYKRKVSLSALAGFETSGKLSVEGQDGNRINQLSYETAPIAGIIASYSF
jgi:hypothetical protein